LGEDFGAVAERGSVDVAAGVVAFAELRGGERAVPSLRYLNALRLRPERFCGSCRVMMSFLLNSASLTRSRHILALMFSRSTVSQAKTLPVLARATMCVLLVKTL